MARITVGASSPFSKGIAFLQIGTDWQFDPDPHKASEIEIRFIPNRAGAARVELAHRGFARHGEGGWTLCLERFMAAPQV
jgi:hypothetical protein